MSLIKVHTISTTHAHFPSSFLINYKQKSDSQKKTNFQTLCSFSREGGPLAVLISTLSPLLFALQSSHVACYMAWLWKIVVVQRACTCYHCRHHDRILVHPRTFSPCFNNTQKMTYFLPQIPLRPRFPESKFIQLPLCNTPHRDMLCILDSLLTLKKGESKCRQKKC